LKHTKILLNIILELTENWLRFGTSTHGLNVALGVVTMVNEGDIIGANVEKNNHSKPRYK
jgi:hypothetical protein